jgi:hypothetical protein
MHHDDTAWDSLPDQHSLGVLACLHAWEGLWVDWAIWMNWPACLGVFDCLGGLDCVREITFLSANTGLNCSGPAWGRRGPTLRSRLLGGLDCVDWYGGVSRTVSLDWVVRVNRTSFW